LSWLRQLLAPWSAKVPLNTWCCLQSSSSSPSYGTLNINSFGFEYVEYIDGQQITKKQLGKPLVVKCSEPKAPM